MKAETRVMELQPEYLGLPDTHQKVGWSEEDILCSFLKEHGARWLTLRASELKMDFSFTSPLVEFCDGNWAGSLATSYKQSGPAASGGNHGAKWNGQRAIKGEPYNEDRGTVSIL